MFIHKTIKARAAWATIQPQNKRILRWVSFGYNKVVKQILGRFTSYVHITESPQDHRTPSKHAQPDQYLEKMTTVLDISICIYAYPEQCLEGKIPLNPGRCVMRDPLGAASVNTTKLKSMQSEEENKQKLAMAMASMKKIMSDDICSYNESGKNAQL